MSDLKGLDLLEESEGHAGDLGRVPRPVADGEAGDHHVRVADGLDLQEEGAK